MGFGCKLVLLLVLWWAVFSAGCAAFNVACGLVIEPEPEPEKPDGPELEGVSIPKMGTKNSIGTGYEKARKRLVAGWS